MGSGCKRLCGLQLSKQGPQLLLALLHSALSHRDAARRHVDETHTEDLVCKTLAHLRETAYIGSRSERFRLCSTHRKQVARLCTHRCGRALRQDCAELTPHGLILCASCSGLISFLKILRSLHLLNDANLPNRGEFSRPSHRHVPASLLLTLCPRARSFSAYLGRAASGNPT